MIDRRISVARNVAKFRGVSICCDAAPLAEQPSQPCALRAIYIWLGQVQNLHQCCTEQVIVCACAVFIDHALRLSGPSAEFFDYGYNMKVNLGVALLGYILWVCWLLIPCISSSHPQRAGRYAGSGLRRSRSEFAQTVAWSRILACCSHPVHVQLGRPWESSYAEWARRSCWKCSTSLTFDSALLQ